MSFGKCMYPFDFHHDQDREYFYYAIYPSPSIPRTPNLSNCWSPFCHYGLNLSFVEFYINGIIKYFFCVWLLSLSILFETQLCCPMYQQFVSFYCWVAVHYMDVPQLAFHHLRSWVISSLGLLWIKVLCIFVYTGSHFLVPLKSWAWLLLYPALVLRIL